MKLYEKLSQNFEDGRQNFDVRFLIIGLKLELEKCFVFLHCFLNYKRNVSELLFQIINDV